MESATLESVIHPCGDMPGSIIFSVSNEGEGYSYYWTDGATGPVRRGLGSGIYTFVVRDPYGCEESCDVELIGGLSCVLSYDVLMREKYCEAVIYLHIEDVNGTDLSNNPNLVVEWADGSPVGLIRNVSGEPNTTVCYGVTVSITGEDGVSCCSQTISCIPVSFNKCNKGSSKKRIIVNEAERSTDGKYQFAELLVIGDGSCSDSMDLRGYIVDDNNGDLIRPNAFVNEWNAEEIGIDAGYLMFSKVEAWSAVPSGSLLVLYGDRADMPADFPPDDPWDSDGDGVYVLSVSQPEAFEARSNSWSEGLQKLPYKPEDDNPLAVSWDVLRLSAPADGMQVRDTAGELVHGISSGQSPFAIEGAYDLWLGTQNTSGLNCRFTGTDWTSAQDFTCLSANAGMSSPGLPNSAANDSLIMYLRTCDTTQLILLLTANEQGASLPAGQGKMTVAQQQSGESAVVSNSDATAQSANEVQIWPNPYKRQLQIFLKSSQPGMAELRIWTVSGVLLHRQVFDLSGGSGLFELDKAASLPSQLLFAEIRFANGERRMLKIVHE